MDCCYYGIGQVGYGVYGFVCGVGMVVKVCDDIGYGIVVGL